MKFFSPNFGPAEIDAVVAALRDGHLATGVVTRRFEDTFREMFGFRHVVAVNSGTTALTLSLMALGVGPGDEVIVTAYSIAATVNCILTVGATPVFCDVDRETYNLDPSLLPGLLTERTRCILPASIFGVPCDLDGIRRNAPGIPILEDSIEALGSTRNGVFVGNGVEAATFGFYPNKQITTGSGGVVVTEDELLADRIRELRWNGYGKNTSLWNQAYGWNVTLPDPLAAIGCVQLQRLEAMQAGLGVVARRYDGLFGFYRRQRTLPGHTASHFIYGIELPDGNDKREFAEKMERCGIPTRPYFPALHRAGHVQRFYRDCPNADDIGSRSLALPFRHDLTREEQCRVWEAFAECLV